MRLICNPCLEPGWNLAADEYCLWSGEDIVSLWRNGPSVIIGKNQNALEEIDPDFIRERNIPVVRRLSGGGAVFHDTGNINFTFITAYSPEAFSDYARFAGPVCEYIRTLGVEASLSGRNDILAEGRKISGNAQAVRKGRMLSHGTLLFSADLSRLSGALRPDPAKLSSKGVQSVRSRVINLAELLPTPMTTEEFLEGLTRHMENTFGIVRTEYSPEERIAIDRLAEEKYRSWNWNFGESPRYDFRQSRRFPAGTVELRLSVEQGILREVRFYGDFFGREDISLLEETLKGLPHERETVLKALTDFGSGRCLEGITPEDLIGLFF